MTRRQRRTRARRSRQVAVGGSVALAATLVSGSVADAATYNVTNLNDAGAGSLRQAVLDANANSGTDDITFASGLSGTITLTTGELALTQPVNIHGPGARQLAVSGTDSSRIFHLTGSGATTISGLTLTHGRITAGNGGAIYDDHGPDLTLRRLTVSNSQTNSAGAGIEIYGSSISFDIEDSTVTGNTARTSTGIDLYGGSTAPATVRNTTISGNHATPGGGGGLFVAMHTTVVGSTIVGNTANDPPFGGGGIQMGNGALTLDNTVVGGNTGPPNPDVDAESTTIVERFSLVQDTSGLGTPDEPVPGSNLNGQDPKLRPLQNNGGPTDTVAPANDSPVLDKGESAGLTTDQRGSARPFDIPFVANSTAAGGDAADMGATELQASAYPPSIASILPTTGSAGTSVKITGGNLPLASGVLFGTKPARTFHIDSNGQITAVAPSDLGGSVDVRVVAPGGTSPVVAGDKFTYLKPTLTNGRARTKRKGKSGVLVFPGITVACPVGGPNCIVDAAARAKKQTVTTRRTVKAGKQLKVRIKLSKKIAVRLRERGKLKVGFRALARVGVGALPARLVKTVTIKPPKNKKH